MQLLIKVENNQPVDHPMLFENFLMVYPGADYDNLPNGYAKFNRIPRPTIGNFQVINEQVAYVWDNGIIIDDWGIRDMTSEEKAQKIQEVLATKPFASWSFNEEELLFEPPTPYPDDGKFYNWDEETLSWVAIDAI